PSHSPTATATGTSPGTNGSRGLRCNSKPAHGGRRAWRRPAPEGGRAAAEGGRSATGALGGLLEAGAAEHGGGLVGAYEGDEVPGGGGRLAQHDDLVVVDRRGGLGELHRVDLGGRGAGVG